MNEKNQDLHQLLISGGTSTVPLLLPWMEPQDTVEIRALSTGEILELQRAIESEALSLREITPSYLVSVISKVRNKGVVSPVKSLTLLNSLWVLYRIIDFTYDGVTIQEGGKSYRLSLCPDTPSLWFENPDDWEEYKEKAREEAPDMYEMLAPIIKVERDEEKGKVLLWVFLDTINRVVKIEPPNSENEKKFVVKWWTVIKEIANEDGPSPSSFSPVPNPALFNQASPRVIAPLMKVLSLVERAPLFLCAGERRVPFQEAVARVLAFGIWFQQT